MSTRKLVADVTVPARIVQCWKTGVFVALAVFALLLAVIVVLTPRYQAHTLLMLPSTPTTDLTQQTPQPNVPQTDPFLIRSYAEIVLGDDLCRAVIRKLNLTRLPAFEPHQSSAHRFMAFLKDDIFHVSNRKPAQFNKRQIDEDAALVFYKKRLSAFNDGRSLTLDLAFEFEDPDLAAEIVNAHAEAYIASQIAYRSIEANTKVQWMKKQLEASAQQLHNAEKALPSHAITLNNDRSAADQTAELKTIKAFANAQETVYTNLLSRYNFMSAEANYVGADTRIVSRAVVPTHQKFPNTPLFVAIAGVLSVIGGCAAAWCASFVGNGVDGESLAADLGTRCLGTVHLPRPGFVAGRQNSRRLRRAFFWEQIRTLRSSIGVDGAEGVVILITSLYPREGKSVVAASLARAIALSGTRTLLLDADLRSPEAHKLFSLDLEKRLEQQTWRNDNQRSIESVLQVPDAADLCLLSPWFGGADVDTMAGAKLTSMLAALRREFQVIIIDSPPVGVVADALNVAKVADSTLVVLREGKDAWGRLQKSMVSLEGHNARVRGFVITRFGSPAPKDYPRFRDIIANDRLVDVVPIPARRPASRRSADSGVPLPEAS